MAQKIVLHSVQTEAEPSGSPISQQERRTRLVSFHDHAHPWIPSYPYQPGPFSPSVVHRPFQPVYPLQKLILIIDDSQTVRTILETCLRREGFQVKSFADGIQAIGWLKEPEVRPPALIWLDIGLPHMDGYGVARYMKAQPALRQTVILMLSCRDRVLDRLKARLAGAQDYLTKPCKTQDIVSMTQAYIGLAQIEQDTFHDGSHR